jgi:hypothetical protein
MPWASDLTARNMPSPPRGLRRVILLAVPPTFAALTLLHPGQDPHLLGGDVTRWLLVHTAQLVLTVLLPTHSGSSSRT